MLASFVNSALVVLLSTQINAGSTPRAKTLTPGIETHCMAIPSHAVTNNSPGIDLLAQAMGVDELEYGVDLQHLVVAEGAEERRGFKQSLYPTEKGSNRTLIKFPVTKSRTYQVTQKFFIETDFDWGGTNEGGKLGFGLAGGSAPTGGTIADDGFTARFMWRGNGDGSARLVVYSPGLMEHLRWLSTTFNGNGPGRK